MCFPLKEEREEGEGELISPLGAEQEAFRECFGLRWTKKIAASVGGGGTYCDTPHVYPDPDHKPHHRPHKRRM